MGRIKTSGRVRAPGVIYIYFFKYTFKKLRRCATSDNFQFSNGCGALSLLMATWPDTDQDGVYASAAFIRRLRLPRPKAFLRGDEATPFQVHEKLCTDTKAPAAAFETQRFRRSGTYESMQERKTAGTKLSPLYHYIDYSFSYLGIQIRA